LMGSPPIHRPHRLLAPSCPMPMRLRMPMEPVACRRRHILRYRLRRRSRHVGPRMARRAAT